MNKKQLYIIVVLHSTLFSKITPSFPEIATQSEDFSSWLALFGLGLVSIMALFLSSEKVNTFKKEYKKRKENEDRIKASQDALLSKLGENIHSIAKNTIDTQTNTSKSENQLLAITTSLIDFLRIKSKKVTIENNTIKLSNLLNDVSGTLKSNTKGKELELIYDIDNNIAEEMISDTLNMSKILMNILLYCVENTSKSITLHISKNSVYAKNDQLFFTIDSHLDINVENNLSIFNSNYNETTEEYDSLGLFISKELSHLMRGDLIARNNNLGHLEFVLNVPYTEDLLEKDNEKTTISKNILVVDSSYTSAQQTKKILESLGHLVKILDQSDYLSNLHYFEMYEILLLDEKLFTNRAVSKLEDTNIKIVSISNIFKLTDDFPNAKLADLTISKPLTKWQLSSTLEKMSSYKFNDIKNITSEVVNSGNILVHRNSFQDSREIHLSDFVKFENKRVLLVEDNIINQKVFVGVLGKSKMDISVAKHGKEALKLLENQNSFDIIFMDINMPVMDGYTASLKIRENKKYDNIPIIALSALTSNDEISKMFASGMNGYLAKPLRKEKLFTVFSIYMENTKQTVEKVHNINKVEKFNIYGLNIELGISKSSSSKIFYKEILREFKDAYGNIDISFEKLLQDFRYEQIKIISIDLKGLSGTIGAKKINFIVTKILKNLSIKKYETIPTLIFEFKHELKLLNVSIEEYLGANN